jgi:hypothetical protein
MVRARSTQGETENVYRILVGSQKETDHLKDLEAGEMIIFKWFLER